jgi:hypothetical protein
VNRERPRGKHKARGRGESTNHAAFAGLIWTWAPARISSVPRMAISSGICTGECWTSIVKLAFFKGASLNDPAKLFNSSLDGNVRRAIDIHEGEQIDAKAFKALVRAAIALNAAGAEKPRRRTTARL